MPGSGDREFVERREADKNPEQAKFTTKHGSQGVTNPAFEKYTQSYPDLTSDYQKNWAGKGVSPTEYGAMHYASYGKNEGRSLSGPKPVARHVSTSTRTSTSAPAPTPAAIPSTVSKQKIASLAPVVETPVVEAFDMAKLTDNMDLSNKLTEIINTNSPLFKAAQTKAMQNMQRRGLVNSTLAQEAVMNSVINVALPIAQAEVNQLVTNLYYNTDWTNKQKMQANEAAYNKMLTQIQGRINFTLQELTGSQNIGLQNLKGQQAMDLQSLVGQQETALQQQKTKADLWAKYGDWVTMMATTEGADQEAWQNMLDMLTGAGGWPSPT